MYSNKKNINLGVAEIFQRNRDYEYLADFLKRDLKEGKEISNKLRNYIVKEFYKLKIYDYLFREYAYYFTTEINVIYDSYAMGKNISVTIDDPEEIKIFLLGDVAIGTDSYGDEIEVSRGSITTLDWNESKSVFFIGREL